MNKIVYSLLLTAAFGFTACSGSGDGSADSEGKVTTENVEALTSIEYAEEVYDFGTITEGEKVTHTFTFTNTGDNDLVIVSAKGSCGCTVPEWPKEPIAPGATGEIKVVFNSEGKKGKQNKRVSVIANTEPATTAVSLKGDVVGPEAPADDSSEEPMSEEAEESAES